MTDDEMPNLRLRQLLPCLCMLLIIAVTPEAVGSEASGMVPLARVEQGVISSLPKLQGKSAYAESSLDLTHPFKTKTQWSFVAAILPGTHFTGADSDVDGGALAQCFVDGLAPHCTYGTPKSDFDWFATPIELYSAEVVFQGANSTRPLLMVRTGSAPGANGGHSINTELFTYDRRVNKFKSVFFNGTGSNNNQETRFMDRGPLRADVIVAVPAGCCYFIELYRPGASGRYASVLGYQGHTVYGDGNRLAVIDSEMPEILRRLGLWHKGDPLPVPREGCIPVLRHGEEWCQ